MCECGKQRANSAWITVVQSKRIRNRIGIINSEFGARVFFCDGARVAFRTIRFGDAWLSLACVLVVVFVRE